jgi:DNA polymerase-3 subunit beta
MNFTITRQNLHTGLAAVSASIPSKTTLPVLSNILFEAKEDGVWMSGTDLDVAVRVKVLADVKETGSLTAPGKKLQEIARELPDEPVEVTTRGDQIELKCGRSRFKLNGLPADEFPTLAQVDFSAGLGVPGKDLHSLIHHTSFAVSTEESRPILNGVLWELRDGEMKMVATNGHRLARMGVKVTATGTPSADFIVPPAALGQVQRLFKDDDEIQVARSDNHLGFKAASTEVYTRLIEGTYPNYEQVIPRDNDKHATVDKKSLESAVRRMAGSDSSSRTIACISTCSRRTSARDTTSSRSDIRARSSRSASTPTTSSRCYATCPRTRSRSRSRRRNVPRRSSRSGMGIPTTSAS